MNEELSYIRDQRTTSEVNIARVYNHSIVEKREAELKKQKEMEEEENSWLAVCSIVNLLCIQIKNYL